MFTIDLFSPLLAECIDEFALINYNDFCLMISQTGGISELDYALRRFSDFKKFALDAWGFDVVVSEN